MRREARLRRLWLTPSSLPASLLAGGRAESGKNKQAKLPTKGSFALSIFIIMGYLMLERRHVDGSIE
jgi:hypothetical protein